MSHRRSVRASALLAAMLILAGACAPAAPSSPTAAPAKPTEVPAAKPAEAKPAAAASPKPAEKTAAAPATPADKPAAAPAKPPSSPQPAAKAAFNEQAVAEFYRGKNVRILVGTPPGGAFDVYSRILARHVRKYMPGNPNIVVENRPGAGGILAGNQVYNVEPKDGTVILNFNEYNVLLQAVGAEGIQFDAARFQWIGSAVKGGYVCAGRSDAAATSLNDLMAGKQVITGTIGPATPTYGVPAVLNATLGTNFKLVSGYTGFQPIKLAVEAKEVEGACGGWDGVVEAFVEMLQSGAMKMLVSTGSLTEDAVKLPYMQNIPVAETLVRNEDDRRLIQAINVPAQINKPFAVAPEVPADRVAALRQAVAQAFADPELLAESKQANLFVSFSTGEEVQRVVQQVLSLPQATRGRLAELFK